MCASPCGRLKANRVTHAEPHCAPHRFTPPPFASIAREPPDERARTEPKLVFVVDDEQDLLDVTSFVLESEGFRVQTARNGAQALALLRAGMRPELVLLDMMMPVMNGWEFMDAIAQIPALRDLPVVVLTAAGSVELPRATELLRKPFELSALVAIVERLASGAE
jgi:CheY-like chemotaxis protein